MKSEWRKARLGDVCEYHIAKISTHELDINNYISTENMLPGKSGITASSGLPAVKFVSEYQKDTVLVSNIRPYFRKIWHAVYNGGCSNDVLVFKARSNCYPRFLYYLLSENRFFDYATLTSKGTKMPRGDKTAIMCYPIADLPPLPAQRAIAATLSCLDEKIELNRRINANLEAQAQALFKSWFVDFEPFKGGGFVDSELGKMPKGWKVGLFPDLANIKYGKPHQSLANGVFPVYGSGGLMRYAEKYLYDKESVLIPRKGTLNNVMYVKEPFWTVDTMFYTEMKKPHISSFIYQFIKHKDLASMNAGTAVPSMTTEILNGLLIVVPPDAVLRNYDKIAGVLYDQIIMNETQSRALAAIRDTLLPRLMSGEIRPPEGL